MGNKKTSCGLRSEDRTGCCGNCWVNVATIFDVWEVISKYCKGTKEEQETLDGMFEGRIDRKKLLDKYDFTDEEKEIVTGCWL